MDSEGPAAEAFCSVGLGDALAVGLGDGLADGLGDGLSDGLVDGAGDGDGLGDGSLSSGTYTGGWIGSGTGLGSPGMPALETPPKQTLAPDNRATSQAALLAVRRVLVMDHPLQSVGRFSCARQSAMAAVALS